MCDFLWLTVPWAGLQCVIVVFSDHTHLLIFSFTTVVYTFSLYFKEPRILKEYFINK